jgi:biofilm PGA synthesis N-glycosyltransferase PgaC
MITRDKIAVLIPVYNESPVISRTIKSLLNTGVNRKDVFVVDDLSTDNTAEKTRSLGVNVFTVLENCGKADAQIAALAHFGLIEKYDWIVFLDGDSRVESQFLQAVIKSIDEFPYVALFVGQVKSVKNDHLYSAYRAFEYTFSHALSKSAQNNFNVVYVSPGCASIYRSDILNKLEIDNLTLAEDMDLTIQVHRLGGSVKYIKEAGVLTQDPNNFKDYHKQILRWYRGFWQVIKKHSVFGLGPKNWDDLYILMIIADAVLFNRIVYVIGLIFYFQMLAFGE